MKVFPGTRKVLVSRDDIASFNRGWPCSTLRDTRAYWFEFEANGDLVDTDCPEQDDGPAARAVADDCKAFLFDGTKPVWASIEEQEEPITPVLFRIKRGKQYIGDGVTAVFPCEPATDDGYTMTCYAHVGQHSGCDTGWLRETSAATPAEYASLKAELEAKPYGYRLKVYSRKQRWMDDARRNEARRLRER